MPATTAAAPSDADQDGHTPVTETPAPAASPWWRFAVLVLLLGAAAGSLLLWSPTALLNGGLADRLPGYWFAPLFAAVYAVGTLAFVPRPALNAAAGLLLGIREGVALAVLGTTLGAVLAFGLARWLGRDAMRPFLRGKVLGALDRRFTEQGFRSVLVLRLLPGMPFQAGNYGAAFSGVGFLPFLTATAIGVVPTTAVYVTAAASAGKPGSAAFLVSAGGVAVLVLGSLVGLWRAARARRRPRTV
ncbi:TVP38/TMEM64 family protein [Streptomyces rubellomurinus]|uniref:TVP38/TMEM64 family protein n=1 Tax=Streptomyces rubellomurinus (strain ATCC 31215) TaxID=359131 RepID=UPI00099CE356|nr:VTT domain-containing protein [Streptomyces rubellomurinus]